MKSGDINFLEPCEPIQACNGTGLSFYCNRINTAEMIPLKLLSSLLFLLVSLQMYFFIINNNPIRRVVLSEEWQLCRLRTGNVHRPQTRKCYARNAIDARTWWMKSSSYPVRRHSHSALANCTPLKLLDVFCLFTSRTACRSYQ